MNSFNWREILAGLTEEQRAELRNKDLSHGCCKESTCNTCSLCEAESDCDIAIVAELIRHEVDPLQDRLKEITDAANIIFEHFKRPAEPVYISEEEGDDWWKTTDELLDELKEAIQKAGA
jgi:hypothetical protein